LNRDYTKKDTELLDYIIRHIQTDSKYIKLFKILSEQLERFIIERQPDIHFFYIITVKEDLLSEHKHKEIISQFLFEIVRLNYIKQVKRLMSV
jgi:hypothetical protein